MEKKESNYGKEYCIKVGEKIGEIMEKMKLKQKDVEALCKKAGAPVSQGTISNILKGATSASISSVANICKGLGVDFSDVLPEIDTCSEENNFMIEREKNKENPKIDIESDIAYKGYLGDYHVYFFPTISNKKELLHGILKITPCEGKAFCKASMKLFTGDKKVVDGTVKENMKEYEGEFVISVPMQSGYCILRNSLIREQCFFVFHHWHIINNELKCRMAAAATTSAGGNRRPTIHRLYMCRNELSTENQKYIRGQLRLNESEILISKNSYMRLLEEENIPEEFKQIFGEEAKLESYYSVTESKLINCDILGKEFAQAISLLRDYSVSPKYNKVSMKTDEFVFDYYQENNE